MSSEYGGRGGFDTRWVPSTIRGYRQWSLSVWPSISLRAVSWSHVEWKGGKITAECQASTPSQHSAPDKDCTSGCGIYALSFPAEYKNGVKYEWPWPDKNSYLINGVIKAGGRTLFGTLGFRAEHAVIEAVHLPHPATEHQFTVRELFKKTFPDIAVFADLSSMYEQYPEDDFSSMYDETKYKEILEARARYQLWDLLSYPGTIINIPYPGTIINIP